jgi:DNA-binding CsgD family transcriptional regulator
VIVRPVLCRPFIGRREELAYLRERRLEAGASHGGLVLIAGDAGVGKSRLLAELCGSLAYSRWRIGQGACSEFARRPYGPVLDVLARLDPAAAALAPAATKHEQFEAIVQAFARIAARTALVAAIEDLHWADAATLELLAYLGARLGRMRVLLLASFRPDALHPDHPAQAGIARLATIPGAGRIDLAPLQGAELRRFIDAALGDIALPDQTRRAIAIAGDGNPFFTEELLKSAVETGAARGERSARRALPPTIRATLLERLRPFSDDERRVVAQAAVIGRTFGLELLAQTLGTEIELVLPALRRARDFQLIEELAPAVFRFRHGLTREAIYADFLGAEARALHRTIALALESADGERRSLEALAYHWWAAGDGDRAAHYNDLAGDAAGRVHAHEDAIALFERALEASALAVRARGALLEKIADRRIALGATEEANAAYGAAADLFAQAGDHEREAACRVRAAITAYTLGLSTPTAPLDAMLLRLDPGAYLARSRVHLGLAWLAATFWFPSEASRHLEQIDPRAVVAAPDIGLRYHNVAAWVAMTVGDVERFRREHRAWVEAARTTGSPGAITAAHYNGAGCYTLFGLHTEALENVERALELARAECSRHGEESAHAISAFCHLMRGDLASARAAVEAVSPSTENQVNVAHATAWGTLAAAHLDDRALIEKWFDGFEAVVSPAPETSCGAGFAEIMVRRGRHADAAALLHRALPDCERPRGNVLTLLATGRYGHAADRKRAREYLARAADAPVEVLERHALALFDAEALQREGRANDASALARGAADGFARLGFPLLEAAAREAAGEADAALAIYRRCGALHDARRLDRAHAPAGPAESPSSPSAPLSALSARERDVAALAASGRTNLQIAGELSISHKTVEKHLGSVYQKLSVSSRAQLAAHAALFTAP